MFDVGNVLMDVLERVVTVHEAAEIWGRERRTIIAGINAKRHPLEARKTLCGRWLITVGSLYLRYGQPRNNLSEFVLM